MKEVLETVGDLMLYEMTETSEEEATKEQGQEEEEKKEKPKM